MQITPKKIIEGNNYVVCINTWDEEKGKYKKVPVPPHDRHSKIKDDWTVMEDGRTRFPLTYEEALFLAQLWNIEDDNGPRKYYSIGVGLEGTNGLFCIDLDGFEDIPEYIAANFQGCFTESSVSGTGYHIFGILPDGGKVPEHQEHSKKIIGVEFYSRRRFIALGTPISGELKVVQPEVLHAFLEYYGLIVDDDEGEEPSDDNFWTNAPYPDYYPGDLKTDDQIIEYLMNHTGAKEQLAHLTLGHKDISFNARWSTPWLCFNDANGYSPYISRSEVDQSVFVDLTYAFGGNLQRVYDVVVDNPFFYRTDKPHKWTIRSIQNALDILLTRPEGSRFLAFKRAETKAAAERIEAELLECGYSNEDTVTEQLSLEEMLKRYVHLALGNNILDRKTNSVLKFADVKAVMAGNITFMEVTKRVGLTGVDQKVKAGAETIDLWKKDIRKISVHTTTFEPIDRRYVASDEGLKLYNVYEPPPVRDEDGGHDISYFHQHVNLLFHDRADDFLDWCAHMVQRPHELPHRHWLHISEKGGTGRGSLCALLSNVVKYAASVTMDVLFDSQFNEWRKQLVFAYVEEAGAKNTQADKEEVYRKFKEFSSADKIRYNDKGDKAHYVKNFSRWLLCLNSAKRIHLTKEDRRLDVAYRTMDECYFDVANGHLKEIYSDPKFIKGVRYFLSKRDVSHYRHQGDARMTVDKQMVIAAGTRDNHYSSTNEFNDPEALAELTSDVEDFIKEYEGSDIVSLKNILAFVRPNDPMASSGVVGKHIINILKQLGCFYTADHRFFVAITPNAEKKTQSHVWILRNVGKWRKLLDQKWVILSEIERPIVYQKNKKIEIEGSTVIIHNPAERVQ